MKKLKRFATQHADYKTEFPSLFTGLGKVKTEVHITLQPDAKPFCIYTPRKIPYPLLPKVKQELDSMLERGVISPVTAPTAWCSALVPVPKPSGDVRLCVDLTQLNRAVQREIHPMPSVDESLELPSWEKVAISPNSMQTADSGSSLSMKSQNC